MKISNLFKTFKNQKGITGADVAIAVSIITIAVVAITMIYVNLDIDQKTITRTAGATRIATNILENIDATDYSVLLAKIGNATENEETFTGGRAYETKLPKGYRAVVKLKKSNASSDDLDYVMNVTVTIYYKVGKKEKSISVNTVRTMNFIANECNAPDLSQGTIAQIPAFEGKTLVKIKYNHAKGKYEELLDASDPSWYSYSSKEWAQVLVFNNKEEADSFFVDGETGLITGKTFDEIKDKLYVWLPNFDKKNGTSEYYFRNGANGVAGRAANNAIVYVVENTTRERTDGTGKYKIGYYKIDPSIGFAGETNFNDSQTGMWVKYWDSATNKKSNILNLNKLNDESKYGPMNIYY